MHVVLKTFDGLTPRPNTLALISFVLLICNRPWTTPFIKKVQGNKKCKLYPPKKKRGKVDISLNEAAANYTRYF